jgi:polysaccharide biosynthesis protein PslA
LPFSRNYFAKIVVHTTLRGWGMTVAYFAGEALVRPTSLASGRISLQHTVVAFLLIELSVFLLCGIAPSFYLETFGSQEQLEAQLAAAATGAVIFLLAARLYPVYSASHILDIKLNLRRLVLVLLATFSALVAIAAATKTTQSYSRLWFFIWAATATEMVPFARLCGVTWVNGRLQRGACIFRALSLGLEAPALSTQQLLLHTSNRTRAVRCGVLASAADLDSLADTIRSENIDQVYIAVPWSSVPELTSKITQLRHLAVDVFLYCNDERLRGEVFNVLELEDGLAFQAGSCPIAGWDRWAKRWQDIIIAALALAILSPVLAVSAIAITLESRGPVFFRQIRQGLNGTHFELFKFRSMYVDQCDPHASRQTTQGDLRVTSVGRFIRRWSIDELPQLFNVLRGSMSLVGPRPHALRTSTDGKALEEVVDYYASRHRVKSGITGWAQVNGLRGELNSNEKLKARIDHDLYYIENWSIWLDLKIIIWTAAQLTFDRKAY